MYGYVSLLLFLIPVGVLCWRVVVSKTRRQWIKIGGASAAMATLVGAATIFPYVEDFNFRDWRLDVGLAAATTGSVDLLGWSQRKHSNRRHRTISVVAAVVGLIPIVSTLATNLLLKD
jgi:hypothetical protein